MSSSANGFSLEKHTEGRRIILYNNRVVAVLKSNPDDMTFTLRKQATRLDSSLWKKVAVPIVEETISAMSWKEAKRIAFAILKLEGCV